MTYLEIAKQVFSDRPDLFVDDSKLSVKEKKAIIKSRMEYLANLDDETMKVLLHNILGESQVVDFGTCFRYATQAWKGTRRFTHTPDSRISTEHQQRLLDCRASIEKIAQVTSAFVMGGSDIDKYIGVQKGFRLRDLESPEDEKRAEKVPVYISPERMKELTTNPIVPLCRKDGRLVLIGKDSRTNTPLLFTMSIPTGKNQFADSEVPLYLIVNGCQIKQVARISYAPSGDAHEQMTIENGRIKTDNDGVAVLSKIVTKQVHFHDYGDLALTHPNHYTAMISRNDYLPKGKDTCQDAIVDMMDTFNIMHPTLSQTANYSPLDTALTDGLFGLDPNSTEEDREAMPITTEMYDLALSNYSQYTLGETDSLDEEIEDLLLTEYDKAAEEARLEDEETLRLLLEAEEKNKPQTETSPKPKTTSQNDEPPVQ